MAYLTPVPAEQLLIKIGDGAGPETFAHPCTINTERGIELTAEAKATQIPDCDDPTKPKKTVRRIMATDWKVSGSGMLKASDSKVYADWLLSGLPKNIKGVVNVTGGMTLSGSGVLTAFTITGSDQGEMVTASITIEGADTATITATA